MISGSVIRSVLLIVFIYAGSPVQIAIADELENLMQAMAAVKHRVVRYQEEKQMELLEVPLSSTGTLEYIAPDKLVRSIHSPSQVRYIIDNKTVTIEKGKNSRSRNLDDLPLVRAFVESFRAIMAGDLMSLQAHYEIGFSGDLNQWKITLQPKDKNLAFYIAQLQLSGVGDSIRLYIVEDSNGDSTRMMLYPGESQVVE